MTFYAKFEVSIMLRLGCRWICPERGGIILNYEEFCNKHARESALFKFLMRFGQTRKHFSRLTSKMFEFGKTISARHEKYD